MSVLVKGMKMPNSCFVCPFRLNGYPDEWVLICSQLDRRVGDFGKKPKGIPKDCPLVEVPTPHGRLIDADELYEQTAEWEAQSLAQVAKLDPRIENQRRGWEHSSTVLAERTAFKHDIADMPTIIEAEEG